MTPRLAKQMVPITLFALSFMLASIGISLSLRAIAPAPDMLVLSPKLAHFKAHSDQYNTIFLGTSRTFYHIVPEEVERAATQTGCPDMSVYNFGVFGLNGAEQDWLIGEILSMGSAKPSLLIIEDPLPAERRTADVTGERSRYFHRPALYGSYLDDIWSFPESFLKQVFRLGIFGYGAVYDLSGVGRSAQAVFPPALPSEPYSFDFSSDGFEALGSSTNTGIEARRAAFESRPETFLENIAAFASGPEIDTSARANYQAARLGRIEQAGIRAGLFISPDTAELRRTPWVGRALKDTLPESRLLNYNQPDQFSDLFQRDLWFDFSHLNEQGARQLSRKIGQQICHENWFANRPG